MHVRGSRSAARDLGAILADKLTLPETNNGYGAPNGKVRKDAEFETKTETPVGARKDT